MLNNNLLDDQKPIKTTISDFLETINGKYELNLPTDFSGDSPVAKLMQTPLTVEVGYEKGVLYEARGDPLDFAPFTIGNPHLTTIVIITIIQLSN